MDILQNTITNFVPSLKLEDVFYSSTAKVKKINNTPSDNTTLTNLISTVLKYQEIQDFLKTPLVVNSFYRSPELNKCIGGSINSQHCKGEAFDFISPRYGSALKIAQDISNSSIMFDQLIYEGSGKSCWVHISVRKDGVNRRQVLTKSPKDYLVGLYNIW